MTAGDILDYAYTGAAQTVVLPPGRYRLECWGAQGGYRAEAYGVGGKGGYAAGTLEVQEALTLTIQVGGKGSTVSSGTLGGDGYNGGGKSCYYGGGGGGASDIRIGEDSLLARVLVAGGGGGAQGRASSSYLANGGAGGGLTGQTGGYYGTATGSSAGGPGATQTAAGGVYTNTYGNTAGAWGVGGTGSARSSSYCGVGGGGGGWYGGGTGQYRYSGGGGGSGYVYSADTAANYPSGCLLTAAHYLADTTLADGTGSIPSIDGGTETGHAGDGYVRITCLAAAPAAPGNFRQTAKDYFSLGLAWDASADATGYRLYRDGALLATLTGTSYTDSAVEPGESYSYSLIAYNADGDSDPAALTASTLDGFAFRTITFSDAVFSVNPCDINAKTVLSLSAAETVLILEPETWYSGDLYSGEV